MFFFSENTAGLSSALGLALNQLPRFLTDIHPYYRERYERMRNVSQPLRIFEPITWFYHIVNSYRLYRVYIEQT